MTRPFSWKPGKLLFGLKTFYQFFLRLCSLNIPCLRINITLKSYICSDLYEFLNKRIHALRRTTQKQTLMFLLVFDGHI